MCYVADLRPGRGADRGTARTGGADGGRGRWARTGAAEEGRGRGRGRTSVTKRQSAGKGVREKGVNCSFLNLRDPKFESCYV